MTKTRECHAENARSQGGRIVASGFANGAVGQDYSAPNTVFAHVRRYAVDVRSVSRLAFPVSEAGEWHIDHLSRKLVNLRKNQRSTGDDGIE